jgi:hypothetical protein
MKLYQQHNIQKIFAQRFLVNNDPGKTHKEKTSERGIFIIQSFREKFFYSRKFISTKTSDLSQICPKLFLENRAKLLEKCAQKILNCTALIFCANGCTDCTEISSEKRAQQSPRFLCKESQYGSLGMHAKLLRNFSAVPLNFCAYKRWYSLYKSVRNGLQTLLYFSLICMLACCLEMHASNSANGLSFSSSTSSLFFLSQKFMNNPTMGASSYPNRLNEGR